LRIRREQRGDVGFIVPGARLGDAEQLVKAISQHLSELGGAAKQRR